MMERKYLFSRRSAEKVRSIVALVASISRIRFKRVTTSENRHHEVGDILTKYNTDIND